MGGDPNGSPLVFMTSLIFFNSECNEEFVKVTILFIEVII